MTVDDVSLDDHEVNVASHIGITAGPRSEQDDPLWAGCRHEPFDSGLHLIGSRSPRRCDRCRHQEYRSQRQPAGPRSRPARRSRTAATEAPASPTDLKQARGDRVEPPAAAYPTANIASPRSRGGPPPSQVVQPSRDPDRSTASSLPPSWHRVGREHHRIRCQPRKISGLGAIAFWFSHMGWPAVLSRFLCGSEMSCARGGGRDGSPTVWSVFCNYVVVGFRTRTAAA